MDEYSANARPAGMPRRASSLKQQVDSFVVEHQGNRAIHSVLIANNGIAAVKFIRSIRAWAYAAFGHDRAITLVALATHIDIKANAEHIHMADQFVEVPSGPSAQNYGNVELVVRVAKQTGVDAVWPGWGHASEKPELPRQLERHGIVFLGPGSTAMEALGDKVGSTILAQTAAVPTLPWSGSRVTAPASGGVVGLIPPDLYASACVHSVEQAIETCHEIGYPVMLKASWGGGGKGIRKVHSDEDVRLTFKQVLGEVPGSPVFTMKVAPQSRHLEVQLLCDGRGGVVSLATRDCSVQRRHQKLVEEGPATAAPAAVLRSMEDCARRLALSVGYVGVATVEFLYVLAEEQGYFLELNPRLQVEHPVTEWLMGVNLPACQLMIGMGVPLAAMPEVVALFPDDAGGRLDLTRHQQVAPSGHVIAVRVTAEHAEGGFRPTCGTVGELHFRSTPNVWAYFAVRPGGAIHEFSDSQFGHVFARAPDRAAAIRAMVVALKELKVRGEIRTNVDFMVSLLQEPEFAGNAIHTGWLDARAAATQRGRPPWHLCVLAGAIHAAWEQLSSNTAELVRFLSKGQPAPPTLSLTDFETRLVLEGGAYAVAVARTGPDACRAALNHSTIDAVVRRLCDGGLLIQADGASHVVHAETEANGTRLTIDSLTCLLPNESDPSRLLAHSPGKLTRVLVADGDHLEADQPFAEMESMKQIMLLIAPASGTIRFHVAPGCALATGHHIATLSLDDPERVAQTELYTGPFPDTTGPVAAPHGPHHRFSAALSAAEALLDGFVCAPEAVLADLVDTLQDPRLAAAAWGEEWSSLQPLLPEPLSVELEALLDAHAATPEAPLPAGALMRAVQRHIAGAPLSEQRALESACGGAVALLQRWQGGLRGFTALVAGGLLDRFLDGERPFLAADGAQAEADVLDKIRQDHPDNLQKVVDLVVSHRALPRKAQLVLGVLDALVAPNLPAFSKQLARLVTLPARPPLAAVTRTAQQLQEHGMTLEMADILAEALADATGRDGGEAAGERRLCKWDSRRSPTLAACSDMCNAFMRLASELSGAEDLGERIQLLKATDAALDDVLFYLMATACQSVRHLAHAVYIERLYASSLLGAPTRLPASLPGLLWTFDAGLYSDQRAGQPVLGALLVLDSPDQVRPSLQTLAGALADGEASPRQKLLLHILVAPPPGCNSLRPGAARGVAAARLPAGLPRVASDVDWTAVLSEVGSGEQVEQVEQALAASHAVLARLRVQSASCLVLQPPAPPRRSCLLADERTAALEAAPWGDAVDAATAAALEADNLPPVVACLPSRAFRMHSFISQEAPPHPLTRAFVRCAVFQKVPGLATGEALQEAASAVLEAVRSPFRKCLAGLRLLHAAGAGPVDWAQIFINFIPATPLPASVAMGAALRAEAARVQPAYAGLTRDLAVAEWAVRVRCAANPGGVQAWRIIISLPTGHEYGASSVRVMSEVATGDGVLLRAVAPEAETRPSVVSDPSATSWRHDASVMQAIPPLQPLQQRRLHARRHSTTYCYDLPAMFEDAVRALWLEERHGDGAPAAVGSRPRLPDPFLEFHELALAGKPDFRIADAPLSEVHRPVGGNTAGVVVWRITLRTPARSLGQEVLLVANDITFASGALGPHEHAVFRAACDLAVAQRLPMIYVAANSGARFGLDEALKQCLQVKWIDEAEPWKGFEYLYVSDADHQAFLARPPLPYTATRMHDGQGPPHWRLRDVIGTDEGLGVECLSGSAAVAAAFSRAFEQTFTLTLVSGRTVGIGAYLARLGRRVIQRGDQPIILTGYQALNKLLGRPVYSSHLQLGGPRVMAANGVAEHVVVTDFEGIQVALRWLGFLSPTCWQPPPAACGIVPSLPGGTGAAGDPVDRPVAYSPGPEQRFDVRAAIQGVRGLSGEWLGGLCDLGSWVESHAGWARTVVTGRARLGGLPVALIGVESETVTLSIPADPGDPDSLEQVIPQAGQVWYPDSAAKTADAIEEFAREGLPLVFLANWRGFSGGQRDLYDGVLQSGSRIVNCLRGYPRPVTVYLPPGCELRGGAWVVIDSQINASNMEMFADPSARGSVLEAEGIVEIKFRKKDLLAMMNRLDPVLAARSQDPAGGGGGGGGGGALVQEQRHRQQQLLPAYHSAATAFAVMHETPARMLETGVLVATLPWQCSRTVLATRLRARLAEANLRRQLWDADSSLAEAEVAGLLDTWRGAAIAATVEGSGESAAAEDQDGAAADGNAHRAFGSHTDVMRKDLAFCDWLESAGAPVIEAEVAARQQSATLRSLAHLFGTCSGTSRVTMLQQLLLNNPELKAELRGALGL